MPDGQGRAASRAASRSEARRIDVESYRMEVAEYPQEIGCDRLRMRNGAIKKDLTGMGDFILEIGVSAEGTAFIHGWRY